MFNFIFSYVTLVKKILFDDRKYDKSLSFYLRLVGMNN